MTTFVMLRGLTREARHWGSIPERLSWELRGARVVLPDLPGNGLRHRDRSPVSVEGHLEACRAGLAAEGDAPPYVLVGLSLGGMVAMAWAARHRAEVRGLVLVNTSARGIGPWHRRLRWHRLPALLGLLAARDAARRERAVLALTARHPDAPAEALVAEWARWFVERPVAPANAVRQLLASARFALPARPAALPVLVLSGAGDALVDPACSAALAAAWGAEHAIHPSAGHDLALDDAAWTVDTIAAWWRRVGP